MPKEIFPLSEIAVILQVILQVMLQDGQKLYRPSLWSAALSEAANLSGWPFIDQNESQFIERIVKEIADQVLKPKSYLDKVRPLELPAVQSLTPSVVKVTWSRPAEGYLKINYDGAYNVRKGGLGVVARDSKCRFVAAKCSFINVESEDEVVAMAALEAVCLAKELGWPRVCFEGDSLRVVNALQACTASDDHDSETSSSSSSFGQIISEIQSLSGSFHESCFSHIHPKGNVVAEILATHALSNPKEKHWLLNPPTFIESALNYYKRVSSD
ncbi:hypothetical protein M0R45_015261 [Rubus argutus]|uniref:RNase H type-1 domain-containing protein n=1 Tax=Rubus argutus TaxID=59490 RepID=A0AAW1XQB4_RUBAR